MDETQGILCYASIIYAIWSKLQIILDLSKSHHDVKATANRIVCYV